MANYVDRLEQMRFLFSLADRFPLSELSRAIDLDRLSTRIREQELKISEERLRRIADAILGHFERGYSFSNISKSNQMHGWILFELNSLLEEGLCTRPIRLFYSHPRQLECDCFQSL